MISMNAETIKKFLINNGVKPSLQRIKIYEYLISQKSHPTVDEIFVALAPALMTLSKTTVYNTLSLFVKKNIVASILVEENETRYDSNLTNHGHFKCIKCQKVYDFSCDLSKHNIDDLCGCVLTEYHAYIKGICKNCLLV
ncbi:MAG: Fur family transcriptional regulator [Alkaliphilus sp.]